MMEGELHDPPRISNKVGGTEAGISESSSAEPVPETVIVITPAEPDAEEERGRRSGGGSGNESNDKMEAGTESNSMSKASAKEVNS